MKNTLTTILCVILSVLLTAGAVCIGARNGWMQEREEALAAGADSASYEERAMDVANLYVVASRHLPADDPILTDLITIQALLQSPTASAADKAQADVSLTALAQELAVSMPEMDSIKQSARDQVYIATLTRTLAQGRDVVAFAASAQDFNSRLGSSLTGKLAALLGVKPIDVP